MHHAGSFEAAPPAQPWLQPTETSTSGRPSRADARQEVSQWRIRFALSHDGGSFMCGSLRMSIMNPGTSR